MISNALKIGLFAAALGLMLPAGQASASFGQDSNAVNYCQVFTPGAASAIRNRVIGVENASKSNLNVACNFASMWDGQSTTNPSSLEVYFSNNSAVDITITCSLLTSYRGSDDSYIVTKSVDLEAGTVNEGELYWYYADNPEPDSNDLGSDLIGINCTLPPGGEINDIYVYQADEL